MYEHMCIYRRCAACSELRNVRVSVHCGVHAISRNVLKVVEVVRGDVRSFSVAIVYRKMFVNFRCRDIFPLQYVEEHQFGLCIVKSYWDRWVHYVQEC